MEEENTGPTVEVRFIAKTDPKFKVTETPFQVPVKLGRFGLSGVINHLLGLDQHKPFDFLIDGKFLRTSLEEYFTQSGLSYEITVTLEYVESLSEPEDQGQFKHDDWVSSICARQSNGYFLTGCYDSVLRVWQYGQESSTINCTGHNGAITDIKLDTTSNENSATVFTSSKDHSVRVWNIDLKSKSFSCDFICQGHTNSVECVDVAPTGDIKLGSDLISNNNKNIKIFCSGSWDKNVHIWSTAEQYHQSDNQNPKKRKVQTKQQTQALQPMHTIRAAHTDRITSVRWSRFNDVVSIFTTGWDHKIKQWDLENLAPARDWFCVEASHAMDHNPKNGLLLTAHSDKSVRMWDSRHHTYATAQKFTSHKNWVSSVAWHPTSPFHFVSGSFDNTIKFWDCRSSIPLFTLNKHKDKVFSVDWSANGELILSGGADSVVNYWSVKLAQGEEMNTQ